MQKKDVVKFFKKKGTIVALSLCLVGGVAAASYYTMELSQNAKEEEQNLVDLNEEPKDPEPSDPITTDKSTQSEGSTKENGNKNATSGDSKNQTESDASKPTLANDMDVDPAYLAENEAKTSADVNTAKESEDSVDANSTNIQAKIEPTVDFGDNSTLTWPVAGTVLIDYSMDSTVYFKTLNVYKYNPALIIGSEVNGQVLAAAKGIVKSIDVNEETGTTITMNIGNNYELVYGQLKEVPVAVGDVVETGSIIGYVSEPTKYYCEEGSNLFFEMKKDGTPVDPFLYLE